MKPILNIPLVLTHLRLAAHKRKLRKIGDPGDHVNGGVPSGFVLLTTMEAIWNKIIILKYDLQPFKMNGWLSQKNKL